MKYKRGKYENQFNNKSAQQNYDSERKRIYREQKEKERRKKEQDDMFLWFVDMLKKTAQQALNEVLKDIIK